MGDELFRDLEAEFERLRIGPSRAETAAVVGDPPWLYPPEYMLEIARTLPDGAGAAALGSALVAGRSARPPG